uniref:NADH-ubiquinone oxidoreductase chain 3 n=1 Tax=Macrohaltica subplicata TaxID=294679 RepID=A0A411D9Z1_9CUCU|nr:NADH dehydrogenase subunit 3 [Macrohaltica subplicata]QAY82009.1 NADH dehydrogenase subunit 3 [Macrohaltica subplicata]
MFLILKLSIMIILIIFALTMLLNLISKKSFYDREKNSPFECGFDPKTSSRLPFSLHFFLITVIFLIFDVEITLLFPLILTLKFTNLVNYSLITLIFISILLIGIYHEWNQGALTWQK